MKILDTKIHEDYGNDCVVCYAKTLIKHRDRYIISTVHTYDGWGNERVESELSEHNTLEDAMKHW